MVGVDRGAVALAGDVLPRVHAMHAWNLERGGLVDGDDARVGVRRMQHLEVQHPRHLGVHGEFDSSGDDPGGCGRDDAGADGLPRCRVLDAADTLDRVLDGTISGAAAEVSLQRARQILFLFVGEGRRRHDHPRGAESTLEPWSVQKPLLHRMQVLRCAEPLDGGDFAALGAESGGDAAVYRIAVEPHRAGTAIACVATLLDAVAPQRPDESAQALARPRLLVEGLAVDCVGHDRAPEVNSARISSA